MLRLLYTSSMAQEGPADEPGVGEAEDNWMAWPKDLENPEW